MRTQPTYPDHVRLDPFSHKELAQRNGNGRLPVSTSDGLLYLPHFKIIHLQADGSYTRIHQTNGIIVLVSKALGEVHGQLPGNAFVRCHHSHVIHLSKVIQLLRTGGYRAELETGACVEISRRNWKSTVAAMRDLYAI